MCCFLPRFDSIQSDTRDTTRERRENSRYGDSSPIQFHAEMLLTRDGTMRWVVLLSVGSSRSLVHKTRLLLFLRCASPNNFRSLAFGFCIFCVDTSLRHKEGRRKPSFFFANFTRHHKRRQHATVDCTAPTSTKSADENATQDVP